jgi:3-oxoacyl-[acyl-carrier protein] reductase
MDLKGTVAIVTGGSGALGGRICHALADAGANVAVVHHEGRAVAHEVAGQLREKGVEAETFRCDVTAPQQVDSLVAQTLGRFGRIDILINDAAYNKWIPFSELDRLTYEEWSKIIDVNLTGPMLCIKAVAGAMKQQGTGRIVNISSVAGIGPTGSSIAYAVAKAGLNHLTKCMAVGLAPDILVNCVAPGFLEGTKMTANLDPEYRERAKTGALLQRAADKDDVAHQVVAFCSTDSITGQTLVVDAGRVFH